MSLKGDIYLSSKTTTELLDTIEALQKGDEKAKNKLYEFVKKGAISIEEHEEIIREHFGIRSAKKEERKIALLRKTKETFCSVLSILVLFGSMLCTLVYVLSRYGKSEAFWFIPLYIWAFYYVLKKHRI